MTTSLRVLLVSAVAGAMLVAAPLAVAKENKERATTAAEKNKAEVDKKVDAKTEETGQHAAYLGVLVEPLHPSLWAQFREIFDHEQGLLVAQIATGSPAENAGLKTNDILLAYGDQKLFSPQQLAKLVRADKPGQQVTLTIVRNGASQEMKVTLGEREAQHISTLPAERMRAGRIADRFAGRLAPRSDDTQWESFDSLTLKKMGQDHFKVEIQYLDKDGKPETHAFEGTREEIQNAIEAEKDLPANERDHLLRALDMRGFDVGLPGFRMVPGRGFMWEFGDWDNLPNAF